MKTLANLARAHRSTSVKILVWEVPALIKHNSPLLELSRKLSSSIQIKEVDSTKRNYPGGFIVVDKTSLAVQQDPHQPLGWVNPKAIARARKRTLISKYVVVRVAQPEPQTDAYLVTLKPGLCVNDLRA